MHLAAQYCNFLPFFLQHAMGFKVGSVCRVQILVRPAFINSTNTCMCINISVQYMVTDTLGMGTFGKVKLAQHSETGLEYAIKIMD